MSAADWSGLHTDILHEIVHRLTLVDLVRFGSICFSWRTFYLNHCRHFHCPNKSQIPWLEVPLSPTDNDIKSYRCCFYCLTEQKTYRFHLPQLTGHRVIRFSSSSGFLISLDNITANLHVINPVTGACIPLPPTSTFSDVTGVNRDPSSGQITSYIVGPSKFRDVLAVLRRHPSSGEVIAYKVGKAPSDFTRTLDLKYMRHRYFHRAIIIRTDVSIEIVVIHKDRERLAFAKSGDTSWTAFHCPVDHHFEDIIFHKGRLHAVSNRDTLDIFDLSHPGDGPIVLQNAPSFQDSWEAFNMYLVESPDGDVFLVFRIFGMTETIGFTVFKLDESRGEWDEVQSLDDLVLLMAPDCLMAISALQCSALTRNCIYFPENFEGVGGIGVFNLGDRSIKQLNLSISLQKDNFLFPLWFTPSLF